MASVVQINEMTVGNTDNAMMFAQSHHFSAGGVVSTGAVKFIKDIDKQSEVVVLVEKIHQLLRKPYHTATETGVFTATMGIASYPNDGSNYRELIVAAEYASKSAMATLFAPFSSNICARAFAAFPVFP